jgi:hypothetical protein
MLSVDCLYVCLFVCSSVRTVFVCLSDCSYCLFDCLFVCNVFVYVCSWHGCMLAGLYVSRFVCVFVC